MSPYRFHVGEVVTWNSEAGYVTGRIQAIHTKPFLVNGYQHHASISDPQYEIVSLKTGHVAYHKESALEENS